MSSGAGAIPPCWAPPASPVPTCIERGCRCGDRLPFVGARGTSSRPEVVGVLLVHGIGEQARGTTLITCAEPLLKWLQLRLAAIDCNPPVLRDVLLAPPLVADEARATIELPLPTPQEWRVVESWWAREFPAPKFGEVASWAIKVAVGLIAVDVRRLTRSPVEDRPVGTGAVQLQMYMELLGGFGSSLPWWAAAAAASVMLECVLLATVVASLLPIARVRKVVARVQIAISGSIGDSYVFDESSIRGAAIVGRVRRDLEHLSGEGVDRIVVVAHSQGAAIAHRALRSGPPGPPVSLITYGSGLAKLAIASRLAKNRLWWMPVAANVGGLLLALGVVFTWLHTNLIAGAAVPPLVAAALGLPSLFLFAGVRWETTSDEVSLRSDIEWKDIYADRDPVPAGPLTPTGAMPPANAMPTTIGIVNERAILSDHSSYWRNLDQFVSLVATAASGGASQLMAPGALVAGAARQRATRGDKLSRVRGAAFGAAVALVVLGSLTNTTPDANSWIVHRALEFLHRLPLGVHVPAKLTQKERWLAPWGARAAVVLAAWIAVALYRRIWRGGTLRHAEAWLQRSDFPDTDEPSTIADPSGAAAVPARPPTRAMPRRLELQIADALADADARANVVEPGPVDVVRELFNRERRAERLRPFLDSGAPLAELLRRALRHRMSDAQRVNTENALWLYDQHKGAKDPRAIVNPVRALMAAARKLKSDRHRAS